ncbi:MAG: glycosyltransferase [Desulfovibrionaceae bacterium]|nr:glycosyltransferase [Desulfovibrionaceae bacterium]MBF0512482.1 glycosyltransferase [Desulfovibrionaceae bacterium]
MKIIHYIPVYAPAWEFGGPVLSVSQLCEALAGQGHEVEVVTSDAGIAPEEGVSSGARLVRNGVAVTYYQRVPGLGVKSPDMEAAIRARAGWADIIHVTGVWQRVSRAARAAAQAEKTPYVVSPRGALGVYSWGQKRLKKSLYYLLAERANMRAASGVHYTSEMERLECAHFRFPGLARVIPNGIDTALWRRDAPGGEAWRRDKGFGPEVCVILSAGRLHHKKGLDLLPETLNRLSEIDFRMVFVGGDDDGTRAALQTAFDRLGVSGRVFFYDRLPPETLRAVYSAADIFVLPSRHENFGNVVLEAMACGCTALISDMVGFHLEAQTTGLAHVLPRDPARWAAKLAELARASMPARERQERTETLRERFDIRRSAEGMAAFYRQILAGRRCAP